MAINYSIAQMFQSTHPRRVRPLQHAAFVEFLGEPGE